MKRKEVEEILKNLPLKFRTKDGSVITCMSLIKLDKSTFSFNDKFNNPMIIGYADVNPPIQLLNLPRPGSPASSIDQSHISPGPIIHKKEVPQ